MTKNTLVLLMVSLALLSSITAFAQEATFRPPVEKHFLKSASVSLKASTLGAGFEASATLSKQINLRLGVNHLSYKLPEGWEYSFVHLDASINLFSFSALADWHPGGQNNLFHITGGLLLNYNRFEFTGKSLKPVNAAGFAFEPSEIGSLTLKFYTRPLSPYIGIGYGKVVPQKRVTLKVELGTIYHGAPEIEISATEMIKPTENQASLVKENINDYRFWPVLSLQINIKLF